MEIKQWIGLLKASGVTQENFDKVFAVHQQNSYPITVTEKCFTESHKDGIMVVATDDHPWPYDKVDEVRAGLDG